MMVKGFLVFFNFLIGGDTFFFFFKSVFLCLLLGVWDLVALQPQSFVQRVEEPLKAWCVAAGLGLEERKRTMSGGPGQIGKKCIRSLRCKHGAQHWEQGSMPRFLYRNTGSYGGSFENQREVQMALKLFRMSVLPFLMSFNFVPHVKARLTHCSSNLSR